MQFIKTTAIKILWDWQENIQIDQWNRVGSPEIDPFNYIQLIGKGSKALTTMEQRLFFQHI